MNSGALVKFPSEPVRRVRQRLCAPAFGRHHSWNLLPDAKTLRREDALASRDATHGSYRLVEGCSLASIAPRDLANEMLHYLETWQNRQHR